jgi:putative DNA primase/helicase
MNSTQEAAFREKATDATFEDDVAKKLRLRDIDREVRRRERAALLHVPTLVGYTLTELQNAQFPVRRPLLNIGDTTIIRASHIGQIYAPRGVGKTWLAQTLALVAATGVEALGFSTPEPCRVLCIDGEMGSDEIKSRFDHLAILLSRDEDIAVRGRLFRQLYNDNLVVVAADWQDEFLPRLDTEEGQAAIEPFIVPADFIFADNRSCLFDPESEKDASAWQPAQDWLLSLRRRGKATMLVHHANRQGGARGHSKPEDPMNLILGLTRPEDYSPEQGARFRVDFDKARHVWGRAAMPFMATLHPDDGWKREPVESESMVAARKRLRDYFADGGTASSRNEAIKDSKARRNEGLKVIAELIQSGELVEDANGGLRLVQVSGGM